jgi:hypothetical protein
MQLMSKCKQTRVTKVNMKFWPWFWAWRFKARQNWRNRKSEELLEPWWAPPKPYYYVIRDEVLDVVPFTR